MAFQILLSAAMACCFARSAASIDCPPPGQIQLVPNGRGNSTICVNNTGDSITDFPAPTQIIQSVPTVITTSRPWQFKPMNEKDPQPLHNCPLVDDKGALIGYAERDLMDRLWGNNVTCETTFPDNNGGSGSGLSTDITLSVNQCGGLDNPGQYHCDQTNNKDSNCKNRCKAKSSGPSICGADTRNERKYRGHRWVVPDPGFCGCFALYVELLQRKCARTVDGVTRAGGHLTLLAPEKELPVVIELVHFVS